MLDSTILASLIGGAFTIIAPLVVLYAERRIRLRSLIELSDDRKEALQGSWEGFITQDEYKNLKNIEYSVLLHLDTKGKVVKGDANYQSNELQQGNFKNKIVFTGGFYNDRFLKLEYQNPEKTVIHFGYMIFELSADSAELKGKFLGYGVGSEKLISGNVLLKKK